ncbi:MAG: UvrD-helicase domain-containing protein [Phycisphaeraceae bacterium]|nr:UvrD-helicase domain-containing protein [Phycisphaeraceae bacterium]
MTRTDAGRHAEAPELDHLLNDLTEPQCRAVTTTEGPLLVLAAAGSGKTRVITRRIAYLVGCGVPAWSILALTFTNRAAGEMRERVLAMLNPTGDTEGPAARRVRGLTVTTFHALCARLLRRYAETARTEGVDLGIGHDFTIYDAADQNALMKKVIASINLSTTNWSPAAMLAAIGRAKNRLQTADAFAAEAGDFAAKTTAKVYKAYEKALRAANAVDFDDLLLLTAIMLTRSKAVREDCRARWQYLLIDEYQDTNHAQFVIASLLAGGSDGVARPNVCVVGDPDQCLPPGTPILTPNGSRAIETIAEGSDVEAATGWGRRSAMPVDRVMSRRYRGTLVRITTEGGHAVRATPNHVMFARLRADSNLHYTYLMWKRGVGYRIGTTRGVRASKDREILSGLQVRANQEVADAMWVLHSARTSAESKYYEQYYSVKYGIPTTVFFVRGRRMDLTQEHVDRLYSTLDTEANALRLMHDLALDARFPHHRPGAVTRHGGTNGQPWSRKHVLVTVFGDPRPKSIRPWHEHRVQIVSSDEHLRKVAAPSFPVRDGTRGTWRIETSRKDYDAAFRLADEIRALASDIEVVSRARLTPDKAFHFMPASHVHPGMVVPVHRNGEIVEDIVASVEREEYDGPVFDLSVPHARNYVAGGIVVHNSIYSWRGADITNILEFEEHYPDAAVIMLGENFRSTAPILGAADSVIRRNRMRKPKDLFTSRPGGEPVTVAFCEDEHDEANLVVDWFRRLREEGLAWRDMAVLYRTNALSRVLEDTLRAAAAPYVVARGTAFYQREEVKHSLAYLRVVANPADDVSLSRIVNVPTRGIGGATLAAVEAQAARAGTPLIDAMRRADSIPGLSTRANAALRRFVATLDGWTGGGTFLGQSVAGSLSELVERVIKESGLEAMYVKQADSGTETDRERLDNLAEVVSSAADFEADYDPEADPTTFPGPRAATDGEKASAPPLLALLRAYLERVSLVADADAVDPAQGAVTLMTLHAAKGLEYPAIAIIGLEEGCLPHARAWESESDLEEERRLFFVGMTRAMRRLQITSARTRTLRGRTERTIPSRFLDEIDTAHVRIVELAEAHEHDDNLDHDPRTHHPASTASTSRGRLGQAKEAFPPGCRVRHPQFGVGTVLGLDGGTSIRVRVRFGQVGDKTLILEYARLQRLP